MIAVVLGCCWALLAHQVVHASMTRRERPRGGVESGRWSPRRSRRSRRQASDVAASLPEAIDLTIVAAAAGASVPAILRTVRPWIHPDWTTPVAGAVERLESGVRLDTVLHDLFDPAGDRGRATATALSEAARDGTSLVTTLTRVGDDARNDAARAAEVAARRLPIRLLFPLVLCILPAFVLTTVVPLLASSLDALPR